VRRLPDETHDEILERLRVIINDPTVEVASVPGHEMPVTAPSSTSTALYRAMLQAFATATADAMVIPYMVRGATDGSFLREKGMDVYGVPIFMRDDGESRAHANDERISVESLGAGTNLLMEIVLLAGR